MHSERVNVKQTLNSELADQFLSAGVLKGCVIPAFQCSLLNKNLLLNGSCYIVAGNPVESEHLCPNKSLPALIVFDFNKDPRGFR